jgi:hypothetical protein
VVQRLLRYLLAATLVTGGVTVVAATPALAVGGCNTTNVTLNPCFDYGGGSYARADFYLKRTPDSSVYYYKLAMVINGTTHWKVGSLTRFTTTGRYCCWYHHVDGYPNRGQEGFTRVWVYRSNGGLHFVQDSPIIRFTA